MPSTVLDLYPATAIIAVPPAHLQAVESYFRKHLDRPSHFDAGMAALRHENFDPFIRGSLHPDRPSYQSADDYEHAWMQFCRALKPLDLIVYADRSLLSKFVASATHGPWSHIAVYMGQNELSEILRTGARRGPISVYKNRRICLAAYRIVRTGTDAVAKAMSQIEDLERRSAGYSYGEALSYGWKSFLGDHTHNRVPNSIIYSGCCTLVAVV